MSEALRGYTEVVDSTRYGFYPMRSKVRFLLGKFPVRKRGLFVATLDEYI